jgi:hypothetical protein
MTSVFRVAADLVVALQAQTGHFEVLSAYTFEQNVVRHGEFSTADAVADSTRCAAIHWLLTEPTSSLWAAVIGRRTRTMAIAVTMPAATPNQTALDIGTFTRRANVGALVLLVASPPRRVRVRSHGQGRGHRRDGQRRGR